MTVSILQNTRLRGLTLNECHAIISAPPRQQFFFEICRSGVSFIVSKLRKRPDHDIERCPVACRCPDLAAARACVPDQFKKIPWWIVPPDRCVEVWCDFRNMPWVKGRKGDKDSHDDQS